MRSYILAVAVSMLLAALYAFQNQREILVSFLSFERSLPQGIWEVIIFSIGAVLMWFFSILASLELRSAHKAKIKEMEKRLAELQNEKESMLNVFKHLPDSGELHDAYLPAVSETSARAALEQGSSVEQDEQRESASF